MMMVVISNIPVLPRAPGQLHRLTPHILPTHLLHGPHIILRLGDGNEAVALGLAGMLVTDHAAVGEGRGVGGEGGP